jgi:hypothetical protein
LDLVGEAINIKSSFYINGLQNNHISDQQLVPQCALYGDEGGVSEINVERSFEEQGIAFKVFRI